MSVPHFPTFKLLQLEDKNTVELITHQFPPYSDFEFASLWAWDVKNEIALSDHDGNLVVRFTDYITGSPLYSFLGIQHTSETARLLIDYARAEGHDTALKLVPEITVATLDRSIFEVHEDRDHFDYIYTLQSHIHFNEPALKSVRNSLSAHRRRHSGHAVAQLNLNDSGTVQLIADLYERWKQKNGQNIPNEAQALKRFLDTATAFNYLAIGILYEGKLAAYSVTALLPKGDCNCLFARADTSYHGIYALLMHETAKILVERGHQFMNYEQDLGLPNLRVAKMAFHPTYFLKKYIVSLINV